MSAEEEVQAPRGFAAWLFEQRGAVAGTLAIIAVLGGRPTVGSFVLGGLLSAPFLALRAWAFAFLGGQGRTRDPAPPAARVVSGPYRFVKHPVYVANMGLALALVIGARVAPGPAGLLAGLAAALWLTLAWREDEILEGLSERGGEADWMAVRRSERSTWMAGAIAAGLLALRVWG